MALHDELQEVGESHLHFGGEIKSMVVDFLNALHARLKSVKAKLDDCLEQANVRLQQAEQNVAAANERIQDNAARLRELNGRPPSAKNSAKIAVAELEKDRAIAHLESVLAVAQDHNRALQRDSAKVLRTCAKIQYESISELKSILQGAQSAESNLVQQRVEHIVGMFFCFFLNFYFYFLLDAELVNCCDSFCIVLFSSRCMQRPHSRFNPYRHPMI
jgi:hypothetical protein